PAPAPVPAAPSPASLAARETASAQLLLSPLVDYIAVIDAADPASASQLLRSQRAALARLRKPVRWLGCNERTREWEPLREDSVAEYRRLRVGLQLVDRRGPVNEVELAIFQRAMQDLADELIAVIDLAPAQPALEAAASLDGFCADVDIQIGINVISQGLPFPGSKLRALAEAAGMLLDGEGRFVRRDDDGQALFVLSNQESGGFPGEELKTLTTHGVTFLLDVPRVAHGDRVFAQMLELARRFAATLHGALVDDNRRPLAEGALEPIRRAIAQSQAAMAARQVPAGSALAQRLFA
ncbi:cell division protein ZipA C-terminal FtsZ-binding domain-containing protein, partial [Rhodocyclus tenuis]